MIKTLLQLLFTACVYFLLGFFSLKMTISSGFGSPIWPAAGFALATLIVYGRKNIFGIILGAFFINTLSINLMSFSNMGISTILTSFLISCGAGLQAYVAYLIVSKKIGHNLELFKVNDIFKFIFYAGPVSCLINSILATLVLFLNGRILPEDLIGNWWNWWIGDSFGVVIFAPVFLSFIHYKNIIWKARVKTVAIPILIVFTGLTLFFQLLIDWEKKEMELRFNRRTDILFDSFKDDIDHFLERVSVLSDFFESAKGEVSPSQFYVFTQHLIEKSKHEEAYMWIPYEEGSVFQSLEVKYTNSKDNSAFENFRLGQNEKLYRSLQLTQDDPNTVSQWFSLNKDEKDNLVMAIRPVFAKEQESNKKPIGYVAGIINLELFLRTAMYGFEYYNLVISLGDLEDREKDQYIDHELTLDRSLISNYKNTLIQVTDLYLLKNLKLGNRTWYLTFKPMQLYLNEYRTWNIWALFLGGLVFVSLVVVFLLYITGKSLEIENVVQVRTKELEDANKNLLTEINVRKEYERQIRANEEELKRSREEAVNMANEANEARKRIEAFTYQLQESQERLDLAVIGGGAGIWDWYDINGFQQWWSDKFYQLLGYHPEEIEPSMESFKEIIHPEDKKRMFEALDTHIKEKASFNIEVRMKTKTQGYRWFNSRGKTSLNEGGDIIRMTGTIVDIHDRKVSQMDLLESEEKFRNAFDFSSIGVALVGLEGKWLEVNKAVTDILGYSEEELIKTDFQSITYPDDLDEDMKYVQSMIKGEINNYQMEKRYIHKKGGIVWALLTVSMVKDMYQKPKYFVSQIQDITNHKLSQQLLESQKKELERSNEELEQFAYVASHDLQEPVRKIVSFTQLLSKKLDGKLDQDQVEYMRFIVDGAKRMQVLIHDLLQYSRVGRVELDFETLDLNEIMDEVKINLESIIEESKAEIIYKDLPKIKANYSFVLRLLQNLVSNAIKYRKEDQRPRIEITSSKGRKYYKITIKDNGIGINPKYKNRIFIIFQRLHSRDKYSGTGIGLAICKRMVERHRGKIWLDESEEGMGTSISFTIPV